MTRAQAPARRGRFSIRTGRAHCARQATQEPGGVKPRAVRVVVGGHHCRNSNTFCRLKIRRPGDTVDLPVPFLVGVPVAGQSWPLWRKLGEPVRHGAVDRGHRRILAGFARWCNRLMANLQRHGDVFVLILGDDENRFHPDRLAAINVALDEVESADGPRAVVTTGARKFYSNGLDLDFMAANPDEAEGNLASVHGLFARVLKRGSGADRRRSARPRLRGGRDAGAGARPDRHARRPRRRATCSTPRSPAPGSWPPSRVRCSAQSRPACTPR